MRQQNFPSLFSVFDALSGFSAFVVVNLILIGGRSIKPVPISYPLSPLPSLSPSLINSYAAVAIPLFVLPQLCLCVRVCVVCGVWCVVAGFSLIFSVLCALCCPSPLPAPPLLLQLLTVVVQWHFANVFVFYFSFLFFFINWESTLPPLCTV